MRYIRQVIFEKIGIEKQKLLEKSNICIVGVGALGTLVSVLLARAGVKKLILIDRDIVELSNLQRQGLFNEDDINKLKVLAAKEKLERINSCVKIEAYCVDLDYENIDLIKSDLIIDCSDNFETRFLINDYCLKENIPWIYGSVIGSYGMTLNIIPKKTPCFRCVFKEPTKLLGTCETEGIINTIPHSIAAMQVTEAIKILTKQPYNKELIYYDIWKNKITKTKVKKLAGCPACNKNYEYLEGKSKDIVKLCSSTTYQIKGKFDFNELKKRFEKIDDVKETEHCLYFKELIIFKDRVLIKADSKDKAKILYDKYLG